MLEEELANSLILQKCFRAVILREKMPMLEEELDTNLLFQKFSFMLLHSSSSCYQAKCLCLQKS